jgi:NADPH-dependent 2,4-dienoyl-CoA reductase/sulfur reductase-like enzyme/ferredoxin
VGVIAAVVIARFLPGMIGTLAGEQPHGYWYLSRGSGLVAYGLIWVSVLVGLAITSQTAQVWPGGPAAISVHQFSGLLGLGFAVFHAFILLGDQFIQYTPVDLLVPFGGEQYKQGWVGLGQTGLYAGLVVAGSWYVRSRIGQKAWRRLHYVTFAAFIVAALHGIKAGTDTSHPVVMGLYLATVASTSFLLIYRLFTALTHPVSASATGAGQLEITFLPKGTIALASPNRTVLDVAADNRLGLPAGCRVGSCGADPVYIAEGAENLSPVTDIEGATLARLGLSGSWRLACSAKVCGKVKVSLDGPVAAGGAPAAPDFEVDASVRAVVIIGNGVAGITAADEIRRLYPGCAITVISKEPYYFYNRMAIAELIKGGKRPDELTLSPQSWYQERKIECLLGSEAIGIDRQRKVVVTDRGRYLPYDRLLLAGGSESAVPPIQGWGQPGCFTLRGLDDAMAVRDYIRHHNCKTAAVLGGGLLGLEGAHALRKLGLDTTIVDRNPWVLHRQIDQGGGAILGMSLNDLGIRLVLNTGIAALNGKDRVEGVVLQDGRALSADIFLASTGVTPGTEVARASGIEVARGILTGDDMCTNDPTVFAAGDIAEHRGVVYGLWAPSAEQAKIAAANMLGARKTYAQTLSMAQLKVAGVDLISLGDFKGEAADEVVRLAQPEMRRYRKLVIMGGRITGAVLLGPMKDAGAVMQAARQGRDVRAFLPALRRGDWDSLAGNQRLAA